MALLKRTFYETDVLSFFPTPYPDESYYSVLCRYMVHSGLPSTRDTLLALFGREISPRPTLLLPYMSTALSYRINPETAVTEETIVRSHTAIYYLGIAHRHKETKTIITGAAWLHLGCDIVHCAHMKKKSYMERCTGTDYIN